MSDARIPAPGDPDYDILNDPNRTICFCHNVKYSEIVAAIKAGAKTHEAIQDQLKASTGCGGCTVDVLDILAEHASS